MLGVYPAIECAITMPPQTCRHAGASNYADIGAIKRGVFGPLVTENQKAGLANFEEVPPPDIFVIVIWRFLKRQRG